ncbi:hypothetical protein PBRA_003551 [Plasmodiophora brassicae]|uniref:Protein kinase domain-containing protein n=1 Tax=Plasmodiophora brassicae TaxID=37360 RepID=A0A0G4IHQ0_PLABS|nr:hypothetical protein PBRA_003551 [Plasmodiophora brassicae]
MRRHAAFLLLIVVVCAGCAHATGPAKRPLQHGWAKVDTKRHAVAVSDEEVPTSPAATTPPVKPKPLQMLQRYLPRRRRSRAENNTEVVPCSDDGIRQRSNYEWVANIGAGSFGHVYMARDRRNQDRLVAIKRQDASKEPGRWVADNEIGVLKHLRGCACVVQMLTHIKVNHLVYLVLEFLSGGTLGRRIRVQGQICERDAKRYLARIVRAVDECHVRHIILNDIKPDNMAFDGEDNLKLIDFGLALYCPSRMMSMSRTTPRYASPEQFEMEDNQIKKRTFDGVAADTWAVGVTLVHMLTGHDLFPGRGEEEVRRNVVNSLQNQKCLERWQHLSQGAQQLTQRILQRDPGMRPSIRDIGLDGWLREGADPQQ